MDHLIGHAEGMRAGAISEVEGDLRDTMDRYPGLFPAEALHPQLPFRLASAVTAQGQEHTADELRASARLSLWIFGLDWLVDHQAASHDQVQEAVNRCRAVASGNRPVEDDPLGLLLAEIRDELASAAAFSKRERIWREYLGRMLDAMAREWNWCAARAEKRSSTQSARPLSPTLQQYLDNADNFGSTIVNITHWIVNDNEQVHACHGELVEVSQRVQMVLRLWNDLATWDRDRAWGDLNALALTGENTVKQEIDRLSRECDRGIRALRRRCPQGAAYLHEQIRFSAAFYGGGDDYWRPQ